MPESESLEWTTRFMAELHPPVVAFDAHDWKDEIIAIVQAAKAGIYVDRLGAADNPDMWLDAVRRGATGIQTDHPAELVRFLRERGWHK
jgi:glycerophosphoryl diester phosphodiesterase